MEYVKEVRKNMFCPLLNNECRYEECQMFVISNGIKLGCAFNVTAKQLDKLAFYFKRERAQQKESEVLP